MQVAVQQEAITLRAAEIVVERPCGVDHHSVGALGQRPGAHAIETLPPILDGAESAGRRIPMEHRDHVADCVCRRVVVPFERQAGQRRPGPRPFHQERAGFDLHDPDRAVALPKGQRRRLGRLVRARELLEDQPLLAPADELHHAGNRRGRLAIGRQAPSGQPLGRARHQSRPPISSA